MTAEEKVADTAAVEAKPLVMPLGLKLIVPEGEVCTDGSC